MTRDCKQFRVANTDEWNAVHSPHGAATIELAEKQPPRGTYRIWIHTCPCGARHITTGDDAEGLGGWGQLPIRDRVRDYAASVEQEARAAAFKEAIAAVMKHGEIIHRGNLIKRLEAAANSAPKDSKPNNET